MAIKANADLYSDKVVVAASIEELAPYEAEIKSHRRVGVVVQTTQMVSSLNLIVNYLNTIAKEVLIYNTICQSTAMRQKEAKELAKESDLMIVVGSKKSANTSHLAEILKACTKTVHIENDTELNTELLEGVKSIGITAGASTPQKIIDKVIDKIQKGKCEMQLVNPLEQQNAVKTLYSEFVSPVCAKYGLTRIELDILLFLANNTRYDTATDIVEVRFLAKSQVSAAIKNLEARGCLRREYQLENRKTAHLRLCDPAQPMIAAGRSAQEQFGAALLDGFTPEELEHMQRSMERIRKNVEKYLEDKNNDNVD